jgi:hypothetical protein
MNDTNAKPVAKFGVIGLIIGVVVMLLAGVATGNDFIGNGPKFGPIPAGDIVIAIVGIVGAIIGIYRKPKQ